MGKKIEMNKQLPLKICGLLMIIGMATSAFAAPDPVSRAAVESYLESYESAYNTCEPTRISSWLNDHLAPNFATVLALPSGSLLVGKKQMITSLAKGMEAQGCEPVKLTLKDVFVELNQNKVMITYQQQEQMSGVNAASESETAVVTFVCFETLRQHEDGFESLESACFSI